MGSGLGGEGVGSSWTVPVLVPTSLTLCLSLLDNERIAVDSKLSDSWRGGFGDGCLFREEECSRARISSL